MKLTAMRSTRSHRFTDSKMTAMARAARSWNIPKEAEMVLAALKSIFYHHYQQLLLRVIKSVRTLPLKLTWYDLFSIRSLC